jgi:hypothetical protein
MFTRNYHYNPKETDINLLHYIYGNNMQILYESAFIKINVKMQDNFLIFKFFSQFLFYYLF